MFPTVILGEPVSAFIGDVSEKLVVVQTPVTTAIWEQSNLWRLSTSLSKPNS